VTRQLQKRDVEPLIGNHGVGAVSTKVSYAVLVIAVVQE